MPTPVSVGIVALGRSGWSIHAAILATLPDLYRVVAVADPNPQRLQEARAQFGCATYKTIDRLLKDPAVELVVVAAPSHLHARYTIKALKAGKAVVCEKPMARTLREADRMIQTAQETGQLLTVFQNRRYSPDFLKVREVIASGVLGEILLVRMAWHGFGRRWDWQTLQRFGGGSLNNTGPHAIDQALQLLGPAQPKITCDLRRALTLGDADDHVKIILQAPGAPLIDIEITAACAYPQEPWLIMGTRGSLTGSATQLRWKYFIPSELPPRQLDPTPTPDRSYNRDEIPFHEESWTMAEGQGWGWDSYYRDLYATLRQGAPVPVTAESARRVMWVIEQCHKQCPL